MYSFQSRVRYSETNQNGSMALEAMVDYFQDASTFHSEDIGLGVSYLSKRNMAWVLSAWQIVIEDMPKLCDMIEVGTFPYAFKGFLGYRNFYMKNESGEYLAKANSIWTLLDLSTGKPVRPLEDMQMGYVLSEKLDMEYAPRKIQVDVKGVRQETIAIKQYHIDSNQHVNNGQYVRFAMAYLPETFVIHQMRAEYKKQAVLHDIIHVWISEADGIYTVSLCDEGENTYATVEFR